MTNDEAKLAMLCGAKIVYSNWVSIKWVQQEGSMAVFDDGLHSYSIKEFWDIWEEHTGAWHLYKEPDQETKPKV